MKNLDEVLIFEPVGSLLERAEDGLELEDIFEQMDAEFNGVRDFDFGSDRFPVLTMSDLVSHSAHGDVRVARYSSRVIGVYRLMDEEGTEHVIAVTAIGDHVDLTETVRLLKEKVAAEDAALDNL